MRKPSLRSSLLVLATGALAFACVPEFKDDLAAITVPRILAVRAEPAEAKAGVNVRLTTLVALPPPTVGTYSFEWALCIARKPLTELGPVAQTCIDDFGLGAPESFVRLGRGDAASATIPADACRRFGPLAAPAQAGGATGRPVDPDLTGGYYQPVVVGGDPGVALGAIRLACGAVGIPSAESIKYNQGYRPNENPEIAVLEAGSRLVAPGSAAPGLVVRAGERVDLRVAWAACPRAPVCGDGLCTAGENQSNCEADCRTGDGPVKGCTGNETYLWPDPESRTVKERREGVRVAWYASSGTFAEEETGRTEKDPDGIDAFNAWTAPTSPGVVRAWLVLRDDRGGVGWQEYLIQVDP